IDLCNKVRSSLIQVLAVNRRKELPEDQFAEARHFDDKLHFRPVAVDWLETMIVMNGEPEELADPLPVALWHKLGHGKNEPSCRWQDGKCQPWTALARREARRSHA